MDLTISRWVAEQLHNPVRDGLMVFFTRLGDGGFLWILLAVGLLCSRKTRKFGLIALLAMLLDQLVDGMLLKNLIARPRPYTYLPDIPLLIPPPQSWSFPSGHSASSFASAVSLRFYNKSWGAAALLLAALIAFSRLYLTVHFFSDILVGSLLGVVWAFVARKLIAQVEPKLIQQGIL